MATLVLLFGACTSDQDASPSPRDCEVEGDCDTDAMGDSDASDTDDAPPALALRGVQILPDPAYNDNVLECSADADLPGDGSAVLSYLWTQPANGAELGEGASLDLSSAAAWPPGTAVRCHARLAHDVTELTSAAVVVLANRAPEVSEVAVVPANPRVGDTVRCEGTGSDPDGDALSWSYAWSHGATGADLVVTPALGGPGASLTCTATASDEHGGSDADVGTVVIDNSPPVVTHVGIAPTVARTLDTLTAVVEATDADGDALTFSYVWQVGGAVVAGETGSSLGPSHFVKGQAVVVSVVADDGEGTGEGVSEPVVIANTVPGAPGVALTPIDAVDTDALVCSVVTAAEDPDVDDGVDILTYSFAWTVDGSPFGGATDHGLSSEVSADDVAAEELWACSVVASDGDVGGPAGFVEVFVEAAFPDCDAGLTAGCGSSNSVLGVLRYIPEGSFTMGCADPRDVAGGMTSCSRSIELPTRTVTLTTPFWMMETELTQGMWAGLGFALNPSYFGPSGIASSYNPGSSDHPVEHVNWWEALQAANEASRLDGLAECYALTGCSTATTGMGALGGGCSLGTACTSDTYTCTGASITAPSGHPRDCEGWRLPTEAEWEYAARAGTTLPFSGGSDAGDVAWYTDNNGASGTSSFGTKPVCTTPTARNAWGLCDLSGNVQEWTWDWYASDYDGAATADPTGPTSGSSRVFRGGTWNFSAQFVRVANRSINFVSPDNRGYNRGLRLVRSAP